MMVSFITVLRVLATCLITNCHYTDIYPVKLLASGGLLGNVIFFSVSGYCLYNIRGDLLLWYGKRILRIYPAVILCTFIYSCMGFYNIPRTQLVHWYLYPTNYEFISNIILLYIPFFFAMKNKWLKNRIPALMLLILLIYLTIYFSVYDKSYYHIDSVNEGMILFIYFESMLLGALFHQKNDQFRNQIKAIHILGLAITAVLYFLSKLLFTRRNELAPFQPINQAVIFLFLFFIMRVFAGIDSKLELLPSAAKRIFQWIADRTLEIYIVQFVVIAKLCNVCSFPANWFIVTASIAISASILHTSCEYLKNLVVSMTKKK